MIHRHSFLKNNEMQSDKTDQHLIYMFIDKYKTYSSSTSNGHFKKNSSLTCRWNKQSVRFSDICYKTLFL